MSKEYNKAYYEKNKEHIKGLLNMKIYCEYCNKWTNKGNRTNHEKTENHKKNVEKINKEKENETGKNYVIVICDIKDLNKIGDINKIIYLNKIEDLNNLSKIIWQSKQ